MNYVMTTEDFSPGYKCVLCMDMPGLDRIVITQFKNYNHSSFEFRQRLIGICGKNGAGKTNLLDAIHYLCFTRSYFSKSDAMNIQFGHDGFRMEGYFGAEKLVLVFRSPGRKEILINDQPYEKFSTHIGKFPCIVVAPDDIELITGGSEFRRKFIDTVLTQMDPDYLKNLIKYHKILQQRNSLLKSYDANPDLLDVLTRQLIDPGNFIFEKRKEFTSNLIPYVQDFYELISGDNEKAFLEYESQLHLSSFESLLGESAEKDMQLQRTTAGIHKDDISFRLNDSAFKHTASQGQRKSLLFALKLAEFELLKKSKGFAPLLLLDDLFEKLDNDRMNNLLAWVCNENNGQVFITDTHRERLEKAFHQLNQTYQVISL